MSSSSNATRSHKHLSPTMQAWARIRLRTGRAREKLAATRGGRGALAAVVVETRLYAAHDGFALGAGLATIVIGAAAPALPGSEYSYCSSEDHKTEEQKGNLIHHSLPNDEANIVPCWSEHNNRLSSSHKPTTNRFTMSEYTANVPACEHRRECRPCTASCSAPRCWGNRARGW